MNDTATNIEIGKLIKNLFRGYDRYCFTMGNDIQEAKESARYITDEIYSCDYDIDIIRKAVRSARDETPKKPPTLTEILLKCKNLTGKNKYRSNEDILEQWIVAAKDGDKRAIDYLQEYHGIDVNEPEIPKEEVERQAVAGSPYAKIILGLEVK